MDAKTILVVEDDSAIRRNHRCLQFAGYNTLSAADGNQGLKQALQATFDLLVLDLILPALVDLRSWRPLARPERPSRLSF